MTTTKSATTIYNFPATAHEDYAHNIAGLDPLFDSKVPFKDVIIASGKPTYSYLELLFETVRRLPTHAYFVAPEFFHSQTNRFFGTSLLPWLPIDPEAFVEEMIERIEGAVKDSSGRGLVSSNGAAKLIAFLHTFKHLQGMLCEMRQKLEEHHKA